MFGSQALDTAIGIVLMLVVISAAASAVLEFGLRLTKKRSKDFERAITKLLTDLASKPKRTKDDKAEAKQIWNTWSGNSIFKTAKAVGGCAGVTYLSAKSFADAVIEYGDNLRDALPDGPLKSRMEQLVRDERADLVKVKAGLERWFDEAMSQVSDYYKRWTSYVLLGIGFGLALIFNASTPHVAHDLWRDPVVRETVANAAQSTVERADDKVPDFKVIAQDVDGLKEIGLPVGWSKDNRPDGLGDKVGHFFGWLLTGLLVMLGAPFWFDLLTRLVSLRKSSATKGPAAQDETSATGQSVRAAFAGASRPVLSDELLGKLNLDSNKTTPTTPPDQGSGGS